MEDLEATNQKYKQIEQAEDDDFSTAPTGWCIRWNCCSYFEVNEERMQVNTRPQNVKVLIEGGNPMLRKLIEDDMKNSLDIIDNPNYIPDFAELGTSGIKRLARIRMWQDPNEVAYNSAPIMYQYFVRSCIFGVMFYMCATFGVVWGLVRAHFTKDFLLLHPWFAWIIAALLVIAAINYYRGAEFQNLATSFQITYMVLLVLTLSVVCAVIQEYFNLFRVEFILVTVPAVLIPLSLTTFQTRIPFNFGVGVLFVCTAFLLMGVWMIYIPYHTRFPTWESWSGMSPKLHTEVISMLLAVFSAVYILVKIQSLSYKLRPFDTHYAVYLIYTEVMLLRISWSWPSLVAIAKGIIAHRVGWSFTAASN